MSEWFSSFDFLFPTAMLFGSSTSDYPITGRGFFLVHGSLRDLSIRGSCNHFKRFK